MFVRDRTVRCKEWPDRGEKCPNCGCDEFNLCISGDGNGARLECIKCRQNTSSLGNPLTDLVARLFAIMKVERERREKKNV